MRIADSSVQYLINTRPDLITQKVEEVTEIIPTKDGEILRTSQLKTEAILGTAINTGIGSIIDVYV